MTSVVIVGGGHNALTAAAYLARAGVEVTVLERLDNVGGAAISATAFTGLDARLSRYAYLVSLLPRSIADDLGLDVSLVRRRYSSYTPLPGTDRGLLIDNGDEAGTRGSFASVGAQPRPVDPGAAPRWAPPATRPGSPTSTGASAPSPRRCSTP